MLLWVNHTDPGWRKSIKFLERARKRQRETASQAFGMPVRVSKLFDGRWRYVYSLSFFHENDNFIILNRNNNIIYQRPATISKIV